MLKVCIADDDECVLATSSLVAQTHGFEVAEFTSGESLLSHLHSHPKPDLVVTDYQMPGKDGLEVLKEIRDAPELKDLVVVVHTGITTQELKTEVENAGGIFAEKPTGLTIALEKFRASKR